MLSRAERALVALLTAVLAWAVWSYFRHGLVFAAMAAVGNGEEGLALIRGAVERAGALGPAAYVAAVVVEVLIAPIPGTLLYAPAGAIFGGAVGGTLSLLGNVLGAAAATWIARTFGHRIVGSSDRQRVSRLADGLRHRALFVVALLRLNPLTSSDLVSYAAGFIGVPVWRVAVGTFIGMAPLCYAQAYASEWIFTLFPGWGLVALALGVLYLVVVLWIATRTAGRPHPVSSSPRIES